MVASIKINRTHIPNYTLGQRGQTRKIVLHCIQFYIQKGTGGKRTSAPTLQTTAAKSA